MGKKDKENKANIQRLTCHIVSWASFLSQKATYFTSFVVIKRIDISNGCQQVDKAEKSERRETRKPHDIITSLDHAHDSAASRKTVHTPTHPHTHQVMQLTHVPIFSHAHTKTKYKHRLTLTKTSAFDISQNPRILAIPKPKRHLWQ